RQIELFESIDKTIAGFERVSWRSAAGHPPPAAESDADDLLGLLETAEFRYRAEGEALLAAGDGAP
ncbi:MAG: hypothetical protein GY798_27845, partial [Hyphomicrobiales bacterium]|nr:hypothetical protein [bacterium]MCP4385180.1 hypothetical protein [Hyphomicrobiales bacterium]